MKLHKPSRQVLRAQARAMIRKTMSKKERRLYARAPVALKREIYQETLEMLSDKK